MLLLGGREFLNKWFIKVSCRSFEINKFGKLAVSELDKEVGEIMIFFGWNNIFRNFRFCWQLLLRASFLNSIIIFKFQVPKISELNTLDKSSYDYFYHQVRYDVLNNRIPEIEYPKYKNDILGLCVTDMYVEMIEKNKSVDDLLDNYQNYIPKEFYKYHKIFAKKEIKHTIKGIKNKGHDAL